MKTETNKYARDSRTKGKSILSDSYIVMLIKNINRNLSAKNIRSNPELIILKRRAIKSKAKYLKELERVNKL